MAMVTIEKTHEVEIHPRDMANGSIGVIRSGCHHNRKVVQRFRLGGVNCLIALGTEHVWNTVDDMTSDFKVEILPTGTLLKVN